MSPHPGVRAAVGLLFAERHRLAPDDLRTLADIWVCGSAARHGAPHEPFWEDADFAGHDTAACEADSGPDDATRLPFTDPVTSGACELVVPEGGSLHPEGPDQPKVGVAHPGCPELADITVELDAFYCPPSYGCGTSGRISGAQVLAVMRGEEEAVIDGF